MYYCKNCNAPLSDFAFYCANCNKLQDFKEYNYFKLFNLDFSYEIDTEQLESKFLNSQKLLHPDLQKNLSQEEKLLKNKYTILVNDAYQNLYKKESRIKYILKLLNVDINQTPKDLSLLEDILEKRELINDLEERSQLNNIEKEIKKELIEAELNINNLFKQSIYDKEKIYIFSLRIIYYLKMLEEIKNKKRNQL